MNVGCGSHPESIIIDIIKHYLVKKKKKKAITNMILIRPRRMAKISTNFKTNQHESQGELR